MTLLRMKLNADNGAALERGNEFEAMDSFCQHIPMIVANYMIGMNKVKSAFALSGVE